MYDAIEISAVKIIVYDSGSRSGHRSPTNNGDYSVGEATNNYSQNSSFRNGGIGILQLNITDLLI